MSERARLRILVVDDERAIADTLVAILTEEGYEASAAYCGEDALERARKTTPDLIISDVMMPGMNGITLAIQVSEFLPSCKVLLFSGQVRTADLSRGNTATGHTFEILAKPVSPRDLLAKLRKL